MDFVSTLEKHLRVSASIKTILMFVTDVVRTMLNTTTLKSDFGYQPKMLMDGVGCQFIGPHKTFCKTKNP
ncbi:MAG: hypothetical protein ACI9FB_001368 [Candidatus Azotimanducaceae bacterium]|jgi:hypothetical protein